MHDAKSTHNDYTVDESLTCHEGFDKTDMMDTQGFLTPGRWLTDWTRVKVIPTLDLHGFTALGAFAKSNSFNTVDTTTNYYHVFLEQVTKLKNRDVDCKNTVCFMTPNFAENLKKDDKFNKDNYVAQKEMVIKGATGMKVNYMFDGMVDGIPIKEVPRDRFPSNFQFIICRQDILAQPRKIYDFRILSNLEQRAGSKILGLIWFNSIVPQNAGAGIQSLSTS